MFQKLYRNMLKGDSHFFFIHKQNDMIMNFKVYYKKRERN